ncbi:MAG: putative quinol monooxygenase [Acetobacteraceae bacterium]|jgi:quinol monooxygenase YgiN
MDLFIFARFHAHAGRDGAVAAALREVIGPTREEPGCLAIAAYRSVRDPLLFYIHSRWTDAAAFESHAQQVHTVRFIERVRMLVDHELDVVRTRPIDQPTSQVAPP